GAVPTCVWVDSPHAPPRPLCHPVLQAISESGSLSSVEVLGELSSALAQGNPARMQSASGLGKALHAGLSHPPIAVLVFARLRLSVFEAAAQRSPYVPQACVCTRCGV